MLWHPVGRYLPEFQDAKVGMERAPAEREMTVLDLLRHTSGLTYGALPVPGVAPHPVKQAYVDAKVGDFDQTIEEFTARLARQPLLHQPGTHWEYSHSTDVVGRVVEVVSGLDLDRFVRERISAPLGLEDTGFWAPPEAKERAAFPQVDPATGRKQPIPDPLQKPRLFSGGGGMVSTALDYARFCQMLLGGGRLGGTRLVSRRTVALMTADHLPAGTGTGPTCSRCSAAWRPRRWPGTASARLRGAHGGGPQPRARQPGRLLLDRRLRQLLLGGPEGGALCGADAAGPVRPLPLPLRHAPARLRRLGVTAGAAETPPHLPGGSLRAGRWTCDTRPDPGPGRRTGQLTKSERIRWTLSGCFAGSATPEEAQGRTGSEHYHTSAETYCLPLWHAAPGLREHRVRRGLLSHSCGRRVPAQSRPVQERWRLPQASGAPGLR
jgi:hypothetical protein